MPTFCQERCRAFRKERVLAPEYDYPEDKKKEIATSNCHILAP